MDAAAGGIHRALSGGVRAVAGKAAGIVKGIVAAPYVLMCIVTSEAGDGAAAFLKADALLQAHRLEAGHNWVLNGRSGRCRFVAMALAAHAYQFFPR